MKRRKMLILFLGTWLVSVTAAQMSSPQWEQARVTHGPTMPPGPDEPIR